MASLTQVSHAESKINQILCRRVKEVSSTIDTGQTAGKHRGRRQEYNNFPEVKKKVISMDERHNV